MIAHIGRLLLKPILPCLLYLGIDILLDSVETFTLCHRLPDHLDHINTASWKSSCVVTLCADPGSTKVRSFTYGGASSSDPSGSGAYPVYVSEPPVARRQTAQCTPRGGTVR